MSDKLDARNQDYTKEQMINESLKDELTEVRQTNEELKKRQNAYRNTIDLLLKQLDEKDLQLESKDELISHIIEESIVQSNKDRYFDFM